MGWPEAVMHSWGTYFLPVPKQSTYQGTSPMASGSVLNS